MAITLTTRLSAGFAGGAAATATSASFTPSANSKLYVAVMIVASGGTGALFDIVHTSNTGGLTFTRVAQSAETGGGNGGKIALFEASVGGSPSAMTVTFDVDSDGAETSYTWIGAFDATGNSVQIKSGQIVTGVALGTGGSAETHTSGTLPAAATTGNTSIMLLGRNNDASGSAATPSGWTALFNPTDIYISGVCFYRTNFTGTSVTITDAGEQVYATGSVLFELEEAGGSGANVAAVTATATATAAIPVVEGTRNSTVAAVTATATATAPAPLVGTSSNVVATLALATALALIPVISGESVVSGGGPATASMQALAPVVAGVQNPTAVAVAATANASAAAPVVAGTQNPTVGGVVATATAVAPAPSVTGAGGGGANVAGIAATATAQALTPSFSGSSAVPATLATSTAAAVAPTVTGGATVTATTATATATAPTPVGLGIQNANLAAIVAGATAAAIAPAVQGITGNPVTPAARTITVPAENRVIVVPAENRTMEA